MDACVWIVNGDEHPELTFALTCFLAKHGMKVVDQFSPSVTHVITTGCTQCSKKQQEMLRDVYEHKIFDQQKLIAVNQLNWRHTLELMFNLITEPVAA